MIKFQKLVDWVKGNHRIGSVIINSRELAKKSMKAKNDELFLGVETSHPLNNWSEIVDTRQQKLTK